MATSGFSGGTAYTVSSPYGDAIGTMLGLALGRSLPSYERNGKNGRREAPATYRHTMPKWEYSSSTSGRGSDRSTRRRMA